MIDRNFWSGKRVLMTGHMGFKGSWLSLWLQHLSAEVMGYSLRPPTNPSLFELANVANGMKSVTGDVRDLSHLQRVMAEFRPEIVIHMAAQPLVRRSYADPIETYTTNVIGTAHLLEAVRQVGSAKAVVCITSDKCYENLEWHWGYREQDALGGYDPYSSSKACAELIAASYRNSYFNSNTYEKHGIALATTRAGNVIGGGDWAADRLVPDILKSLLNRESVLIRNPYATRPWQHVLEPLNGYLMLAERLYNDGVSYAEAWNFGPDSENVKTVGWIADYLYQCWGDGLEWQRDQSTTHAHENTFLKLDCSKAQVRLGWRPQLDLDATLDWIVSWTKAYQAGKDMRSVTQEQIQMFMTMDKQYVIDYIPSNTVFSPATVAS